MSSVFYCKILLKVLNQTIKIVQNNSGNEEVKMLSNKESRAKTIVFIQTHVVFKINYDM